ncbi:MAG: amidase family protein [Ruthenibacterium lactatiformans]
MDDVALLFSAICGRDAAHDATSKEYAFPGITTGVKGLRVGVPKEYFGKGVSAENKAAVLKAVDDLKALGAEIVEIFASTGWLFGLQYHSSAEASSNLARYDGINTAVQAS